MSRRGRSTQVVHREVHEVHQQERVYTDRYFWLPLLQGGEVRLLPDSAEHRADHGSEHRVRICITPGQARDHGGGHLPLLRLPGVHAGE